jgi:hypothetical protein
LWDSCCSIFLFLCSVLKIIVWRVSSSCSTIDTRPVSYSCYMSKGISSILRRVWKYQRSNWKTHVHQTELLTLPGKLCSLRDFCEIRVAQYFFFCVVFCRSLFDCLVIVLSVLLWLNSIQLYVIKDKVCQWLAADLCLSCYCGTWSELISN